MKDKHLSTTLIIGALAGLFGGLIAGPFVGIVIFIIAVSIMEHRDVSEKLERLKERTRCISCESIPAVNFCEECADSNGDEVGSMLFYIQHGKHTLQFSTAAQAKSYVSDYFGDGISLAYSVESLKEEDYPYFFSYNSVEDARDAIDDAHIEMGGDPEIIRKF